MLKTGGQSRFLPVGVLSGVAAVLVAAAIASASASAVRLRSSPCTTAQLKIRLIHSGAAAGTVGGYIAFTNRASVPCRLSGWPTLVATAATGKSTAAVHRRSTMFGPSPLMKGVPVVTLHPGQRADAVFTVGDNPGPGQTICPSPYRHLRITPPGNTRSVLISAWLPYYNQYLPACTSIDVSMVVPAGALYHG